MSTMDSSQSPLTAELWMAAALLGQPPAAKRYTGEPIGQVAAEHGVAPLLHDVLARQNSWQAYPPEWRDTLSHATRQQLAWDLLRESDLGRLLDQFDQAGIRYLLIKGAGLAYTHYQQSYLRTRCDSDILFADQAAFEQAWALLETDGFLSLNTLSGEFVGYQHCCYRVLESGFHQVLDCHIKINDYLFYADAFGFDELLEHSVAVPQLADSARTLGPVHALLMACMHQVATLPHGNAHRLIWLFDMYLLASSFSDDQWSEFQALASERKLCGSCVFSLDAAQVFFPLAIPAGVMAEMQRVAEKEPFKPRRDMKRWQYYYHVFKATPGVRKKAQLLREHFLPSPAYLAEKYQTNNRFVLPFLYVHRVFAGLKRYF